MPDHGLSPGGAQEHLTVDADVTATEKTPLFVVSGSSEAERLRDATERHARQQRRWRIAIAIFACLWAASLPLAAILPRRPPPPPPPSGAGGDDASSSGGRQRRGVVNQNETTTPPPPEDDDSAASFSSHGVVVPGAPNMNPRCVGANASQRVLIIRHCEKDGSSRTKCSKRGFRRARWLPTLFVGDQRRWDAPSKLFARKAEPKHYVLRSVETLEPLADAIGVPINDTYGAADVDAFVAALRALLRRGALCAAGPALVCWKHEQIPLLADALGYAPPKALRSKKTGLLKWKSSDFDSVVDLNFTLAPPLTPPPNNNTNLLSDPPLDADPPGVRTDDDDDDAAGRTAASAMTTVLSPWITVGRHTQEGYVDKKD